MERVGKPSSRQKAEGIKLDFRLHFHASRVPTSGWDKLVVSLLSIETGRILVKTSRGVVRNGSCGWPDAVEESARLFQNPSTGQFNDKLYKLFIQMGSLRAGILGEAMINLAEYVAAESPETISLPLRNCSSGTILHVKIQCLTPKTGMRELEGQRMGMRDQGSPSSEDNSSSSDMSENPTLGIVGSSASQKFAAQQLVQASKGHHRNNGAPANPDQNDEPLPASLPNFDFVDYSSDKITSSAILRGCVSGEMPLRGPENHLLHRPSSTTGTDSFHSQERNKIFHPKYQDRDSNFSNLRVANAEFMNAKSNLPVKDYGAWVAAGLPQKLEAAEATIQELQEESSIWERQARKLAVEVETFRQKLAYESKLGSELKLKISAAEAECDSLKAEVAQLKALKVTPNVRSGTDNFSREVERSRKMIKVLQEEIGYEKEVNANLQMQLCKTQDSNADLLLTLRELEDIIEASNKVVEKLSVANKKLENELFDACKELGTFLKCSGDAEAQSADERGRKHSLSTMEAVTREKEQKIMRLEFQALESKSAQQQDEKSFELESISEESNDLNAPSKSKTGELEFRIPELEANTRILEDAVHAFEKEKGVLLQKIENETEIRSQLEAEVVKLVTEMDKLALDIAARDTSIEKLNLHLAEVKGERVVLDGRIKNLLGEQIFSSDMYAEEAKLYENQEEAHLENSRQTQRLEELVEEMVSLRNVLDSRASENGTLESQRTELLVIQGKLEGRICELEELNASLSEKVSSLKVQLSITSQDQADYRHINEAAKDERLAYQNQIDRPQTHQTLLQQELQDATNTCALMRDKVRALEIQMQQQQQDINNREYTLRLQLDSLLSDKKSLDQAAKNADEAPIAAKEDNSTALDPLQTRIERLSMIVDEKENMASHAMGKVAELEAEKLDLKNSLAIMEEKVKDLEQLSEGLDIELKDALMELDTSKTLCNNLTQRLQEKESVLYEHLSNLEKQEIDFRRKAGILEEELLQKANRLSIMESQLALCEGDSFLKKTNDSSDVIELQERLRCLEAEIKASKEELIACKKDFLQKEAELTCKIEHLELSNERLTAGLIDSGAEQLQKELIRLQNQNSFLSRKEQELLSQMHTQEVLQEEVKRLQEANDLLEARLSKFVETAKNPFLLEKIVSLETELAEAVEANNVYKQQLKSLFDKQQLGDLDQVIEDHYQYKKKATQLQGDLDNMHERYTLISLKLAEAEAERGELMITLKNLKGINKK